MWLRGAGFLRVSWKGFSRQDVENYLLDEILHELPDSLAAPPQPYSISGGLASERANRPQAGVQWGSFPEALLDAWAFYAWDPGRFVAALPERLRHRYPLYRGRASVRTLVPIAVFAPARASAW